MLPTFYKVRDFGAGTHAVMAKPVAGEYIEEEFSGLAASGFHQVISLLEAHEAFEVGLSDEARLCEQNRLRFASFPIRDRGVPSNVGDFARITGEVCNDVWEGRSTVVHCRAGIGRTGLFAAGILMHAGVEADKALDFVAKSRGVEVLDTEEQAEWLRANSAAIRSLDKAFALPDD